MAEVAGGEPRIPEELVLWEILTRLPSKHLLRCRAVCRSWRRLLTSDEVFLLAHHRRQPALQLVTMKDDRQCRIEVLDHGAGERRPVARTDRATTREDLHLLAACDGLLLVSAYRAYYICNPATRQCAPLPFLRFVYISGLYPHRPSRSYRILCWSKTKVSNDAADNRAFYYVYTVGSSELRCVDEPPEQWPTKDISPLFEYCYPPVLVQGRFHWRPVVLRGSKCNNMVVQTPVEGPSVELFEMKGKLGLYSYNNRQTADLWVLQDYEHNLWSFKHRIKLERPAFFLVPDAQGGLLVTSLKKRGTVLQKYLSGGSVVAGHVWNVRLNLTRHRFKESLVRHDFFLAKSNVDVDETPLFHGLSTVVVPSDDNSE